MSPEQSFHNSSPDDSHPLDEVQVLISGGMGTNLVNRLEKKGIELVITNINLSLPRILIGRIPWFHKWVLPQWFRDLPKEQPIAVICLTSHRSPIAAEFLMKEGFLKVFNITGGMMEWRQLKLEIDTSEV